jgi:heparinase II/III-like protein
MNPLTSHSGLAERLHWQRRRLSTMSPAEMAWRCVQFTVGAARRPDLVALPGNRLLRDGLDWEASLQRFRDSVDRSIQLDRARAQSIGRSRPDKVDDVIKAAKRAAAGRFAIFGYPEATLSDSIDWHFDPVAAFRCPQVRSAKLDHRTARGDRKWTWELNRLQHLPWFAQAWLFTGYEHFAELALSQLDSWMSQNPAGVGIACVVPSRRECVPSRGGSVAGSP